MVHYYSIIGLQKLWPSIPPTQIHFVLVRLLQYLPHTRNIHIYIYTHISRVWQTLQKALFSIYKETLVPMHS